MRRSRAQRPFTFLLVAVLTVGFASATFPLNALAAVNCAQHGLWFAGWWSSQSLTGHEPEGANASLTYRHADSCQSIGGGFDASYSGWVMIGANVGQWKYAQAGFYNDGNPLGCTRHFSEWSNATSDGHYHRITGSCTSDGEVHVPKVSFTSTNTTQMWIDSTLFDTMTICSCSWPRPLIAEYLGETHDINGDVPGLSTSKTDWAGTQIQYFSDDTWHGTCSTITLHKLVTNSRFSADAPACNHTRSWTAQP